MKKEVHPKYGPTTIRCACGNVMETKSTVMGTVQVDLCSSCHPFFTGQQRVMDTAGRIDRFKKKFGDKVVSAAPTYVKSAPAPVKPVKAKKTEEIKGLKDIKGTQTAEAPKETEAKK